MSGPTRRRRASAEQATRAAEAVAAPTAAPTTAKPTTTTPSKPTTPSPPPNYTPTPGTHPHHDDPFLTCVRARESGGNYGAVNPAGPYLGAYQFYPSTWNAAANHAGRSELVGVPANLASAYDQDDVAWALYQWQGKGPWGGELRLSASTAGPRSATHPADGVATSSAQSACLHLDVA